MFNGIINPKAWRACASLDDVSVAPGEIRREETMSPVACFHFAFVNPNQFYESSTFLEGTIHGWFKPFKFGLVNISNWTGNDTTGTRVAAGLRTILSQNTLCLDGLNPIQRTLVDISLPEKYWWQFNVMRLCCGHTSHTLNRSNLQNPLRDPCRTIRSWGCVIRSY